MKSNRTTALLLLLIFLVVVAVVIIFLTGLDNNPQQNRRLENVTVSAVPIIAETPTPTPEPTPTPTTAPTSSVPVYYPPATSAPASTSRPAAVTVPTQNTTGPVVAVPSGGATVTGTGTASGSGSGVAMVPAQDLLNSDGAANGNTAGTEASATFAPVQIIPVGSSLGSGTFRSDTGTSLNIHADWSAIVSGESTVDITVTVYVDSYSLYTTASPQALNLSVDGQYVALASPAIEYDGSGGIKSTLINNRSVTVSLTAGESRNIPLEAVWLYRGTYAGISLETIECGGSISLSR